MRVWVKDHTICLDAAGACFFLRPCASLDGKFQFNGHDIPWFRRKRIASGSGRSIWTFFSVPYLCAGVARAA